MTKVFIIILNQAVELSSYFSSQKISVQNHNNGSFNKSKDVRRNYDLFFAKKNLKLLVRKTYWHIIGPHLNVDLLQYNFLVCIYLFNATYLDFLFTVIF